MKRILSITLLCLCFLLCLTPLNTSASTIEEPPVEITPYASKSLFFNGPLDSGMVIGLDKYSIINADTTFEIIDCTWTPANEDISIGLYNNDTGDFYSRSFSGGDIPNTSIPTTGVPDGVYRVAVKFRKNCDMHGVLQYNIT